LVKFLIYRPIAVIMVFIALLILGTIAAFRLPVSLMPNIDIPEVTVQISYKNTTARELENNIVSPIRSQLLQVQHLADIQSETRNGNAIIHLKFEYGTPINLAYIEVNETIDRVMSQIPRDMQRPIVIKARPTDIPVFNLIVTHKNDSSSVTDFIEISQFVRSVIRPRLEQLPEIAMVDVSGYTTPQLTIIPYPNLMQSLDIKQKDIEDALLQNNIHIGNLTITDRQYNYNIRFASYLRTEDDVRTIFFKKDDHIYQLKDIAHIELTQAIQTGKFMANGTNAVVMCVIKQADARMDYLKEKTAHLIRQMQNDYPELHFEVANDQTELLDISISNLKTSLILGSVLAILVMFVFMQNFRAPLLIALTIPISLTVSMLFLWLWGVSINIISLAGLILGVGMMVDNSIIIIDNINQHHRMGQNLSEACIRGVNEVIRPLISSLLTTCAVFVPLVFLSGIAGALFLDQAISVSFSLLSSLLVSITLLPVLYRLLYNKRADTFGEKRVNIQLMSAYERSMNYFFGNKKTVLLISIVLIISTLVLYQLLKVQRLPFISRSDMNVRIDWNQQISIDENSVLTQQLMNSFTDTVTHFLAQIGHQQFLLHTNQHSSYSEVDVYIKTTTEENLENIENSIHQYFAMYYPEAKYSIRPSENIFDRLFADNSADLEIQIRAKNQQIAPQMNEMDTLVAQMAQFIPELNSLELPLEEYIEILLIPEKLILYDVSTTDIYTVLYTAFGSVSSGFLSSYQQFIPIRISSHPEQTISQKINSLFVKNKTGELIPVSLLIEKRIATDFKTITSAKNGEYISFGIENPLIKKETYSQVSEYIAKNSRFEVEYSGKLFSNTIFLTELIAVVIVSFLLLYFILAIQFESLLQPLIVLIELPIDMFGVLLMLYIFGSSINIMSAIGIVVMSGIVVNDSIIKIDTINHLRRNGMEIKQAIIEGGHQRLLPIIMTSLTTILALIPVLFSKGMGNELQLPLALAVIGGMLIGTFVSIYLIPLLYFIFEVKISKKE